MSGERKPLIAENPRINPGTGKPWTAPQLLKALKECNEIANVQATRHGYCSTWELIMRLIVRKTGLPFEGRGDVYVHETSVDFEELDMANQAVREAEAALRATQNARQLLVDKRRGVA